MKAILDYVEGIIDGFGLSDTQLILVIGTLIFVLVVFVCKCDLVGRLRKMSGGARGTPEGVGSDRFILYHADWCGHCKSLMPAWEKLENKYSSQYNIVKFEADKNEDEVSKAGVEGFPTIVKEKSNGEVVPYNGDRSFADLEKFLLKA